MAKNKVFLSNVSTSNNIPIGTQSKKVRNEGSQIPERDTMDIKKFINHVELFAENKINFTFENPGIAHAGAVLCVMAKYAKENFIVYDENLEGDITNGTDFYIQIEKFLDRGGKFSIITKVNPKDNEPKNTLLNLRNKFKENVELSYINPDAFLDPQFDQDLVSKCFTVIDNTGYRLESDFLNRKASFNFNNVVESEKLREKFEKIKVYSCPV